MLFLQSTVLKKIVRLLLNSVMDAEKMERLCAEGKNHNCMEAWKWWLSTSGCYWPPTACKGFWLTGRMWKDGTKDVLYKSKPFTKHKIEEAKRNWRCKVGRCQHAFLKNKIEATNTLKNLFQKKNLLKKDTFSKEIGSILYKICLMKQKRIIANLLERYFLNKGRKIMRLRLLYCLCQCWNLAGTIYMTPFSVHDGIANTFDDLLALTRAGLQGVYQQTLEYLALESFDLFLGIV